MAFSVRQRREPVQCLLAKPAWFKGKQTCPMFLCFNCLSVAFLYSWPSGPSVPSAAFLCPNTLNLGNELPVDSLSHSPVHPMACFDAKTYTVASVCLSARRHFAW